MVVSSGQKSFSMVQVARFDFYVEPLNRSGERAKGISFKTFARRDNPPQVGPILRPRTQLCPVS